jgi:hypothetical protein
MNIYMNCQCTSITRRIVKPRETEMKTPPQKKAKYKCRNKVLSNLSCHSAVDKDSAPLWKGQAIQVIHLAPDLHAKSPN